MADPKAQYNSGRGFQDINFGDYVIRQRSGYRTQSLWQGRSNFLQTSGSEDRSIMPNTTVPRGTGRGGPMAQAAWRFGKDYAKTRLGVPDISLGDWGSGGYKVSDVVAAVKSRNAGTNFMFNQPVGPSHGPLKPPPGFGPPAGPAAGPGPGPGPLPNPSALPKPVGVPPHPTIGPIGGGGAIRFGTPTPGGATGMPHPTMGPIGSTGRPRIDINDPRVLGGVNAAVKAGQAVTGVLGGEGAVSKAARAGVAAATGGWVRPSVTKAAAQAGGRAVNAAAGKVAKTANIDPFRT
jgi:hypothetical protein